MPTNIRKLLNSTADLELKATLHNELNCGKIFTITSEHKRITNLQQKQQRKFVQNKQRLTN